MKQDYFRIYNCYDERENRLSIFGRIIGEEIELWVWKCNKKDSYSKKTAREAYEFYLKTGKQSIWETIIDKKTDVEIKHYIKPEVFTIPILDEKPGKSFVNYCKQNYWTKEKPLDIKVEMIIPVVVFSKKLEDNLSECFFQKKSLKLKDQLDEEQLLDLMGAMDGVGEDDDWDDGDILA